MWKEEGVLTWMSPLMPHMGFLSHGSFCKVLTPWGRTALALVNINWTYCVACWLTWLWFHNMSLSLSLNQRQWASRAWWAASLWPRDFSSICVFHIFYAEKKCSCNSVGGAQECHFRTWPHHWGARSERSEGGQMREKLCCEV